MKIATLWFSTFFVVMTAFAEDAYSAEKTLIGIEHLGKGRQLFRSGPLQIEFSSDWRMAEDFFFVIHGKGPKGWELRAYTFPDPNPSSKVSFFDTMKGRLPELQSMFDGRPIKLKNCKQTEPREGLHISDCKQNYDFPLAKDSGLLISHAILGKSWLVILHFDSHVVPFDDSEIRELLSSATWDEGRVSLAKAYGEYDIQVPSGWKMDNSDRIRKFSELFDITEEYSIPVNDRIWMSFTREWRPFSPAADFFLQPKPSSRSEKLTFRLSMRRCKFWYKNDTGGECEQYEHLTATELEQEKIDWDRNIQVTDLNSGRRIEAPIGDNCILNSFCSIVVTMPNMDYRPPISVLLGSVTLDGRIFKTPVIFLRWSAGTDSAQVSR